MVCRMEVIRGIQFRQIGSFGGSRRRRVRRIAARRVDPAADQFGRFLQDFSQLATDVGPLAKRLGDDVPHTGKHLVDAGEVLLRSDERSGPRGQVSRGRIGLQHFVGQRLEATLPSGGGQRLLLRLVGKIQILQSLGRGSGADLISQFRSHQALRLDRLENGLFAFSQGTELPHALLHATHLVLVQSTRLLFAETSDERNRVAFIQQVDGILDALQWQT